MVDGGLVVCLERGTELRFTNHYPPTTIHTGHDVPLLCLCEDGRSRTVRSTEVDMAGQMKCAHPACQCTVEPKGRFGKYCSDHCRQAGDKIELRCDCQHPPCRET
jgi:hypothetical protein